jgi:hypothetical protein
MTWDERKQLVEECLASGKTIRAWCQERGISNKSISNWRRRIREIEMSGGEETSVTWAGVRVNTYEGANPNSGTVTISRGGWSVAFSDGIETGTLEIALKAVMRVCC